MNRLRMLLAPGLLMTLMGVATPAPAQAQESACVRRHVPSPDTFSQMTTRYADSNINTVSADQFQSLPAGPDIPNYDQHQGGFDLAMWQIYSGNANRCAEFGLSQGALIQASGGTEVDVLASAAPPPAPWCSRRHVPDQATLQTITSIYPTAATNADISTHAFQNMLVGKPIPEPFAGDFWSQVGQIYDQGFVGTPCAQHGLRIGQLIQAGGETDVVDAARWNKGVACLRQATPPSPPMGGAVLAMPLDPNALDPNVVLMTAPSHGIGYWGDVLEVDATGVCGGAVVRQPTSIAVGDGAALSFQSAHTNGGGQLISAWGALAVDGSGSSPVLFPGHPEFIPVRATIWAGSGMPAFAEAYTSCRGCDLAGAKLETTPRPDVAYYGNFSGANLSGATFEPSDVPGYSSPAVVVQKWDFTNANLSNVSGLNNAFMNDAVLRGANLSHTDLSGTSLDNADLSGAKLNDAVLDGSTRLSGANLTGADLSGLDLHSVTQLSLAKLSKANLSDTNLRTQDLSGVDLSAADLSNSLFDGAILDRANLRGTKLIDAEADDASFQGSDFAGADLTGAKIGGPVDQTTNFSGANLSKTSLQDVSALNQANLSNVNLTSTDLHGIDLSDAKLSGAKFQQATLSYLDMHGADLSGADLSGTDLTLTPLYGADLSGADLSGANLTGANLETVRMSGATVSGTNFELANFYGTQIVGLQYVAAPSFTNIGVGRDHSGTCTVFQDVDFRRVSLTVRDNVPGCEKSPLLPGSAVRVGTVAVWLQTPSNYVSKVNLSKAILVASGSDRSALAGLDLTGIDLSQTAFVGWSHDLSKTIFDKADLTGARFDGATLAGASFQNVTAPNVSLRGAKLAGNGSLKAATFQNGLDPLSPTNLQGADFVGADVSGASFNDADLRGAVFSRALAVGTTFTGVIATNAVFVGAHIHGDGKAFDQADDLTGADFSGAVLAASNGFDLSHTNLTGAKFDFAQCIGCDFSSSKLDHASFISAYLVGAVFSSATLPGADMYNAWLYCGDVDNSRCHDQQSSTLKWPLVLGFGEESESMAFAPTNMTGVSLQDMKTCPDGSNGSDEGGCNYHLLPDVNTAPPIPAPCSSASFNACPTTTTTVFDSSSLKGKLLSVVPMTPTNWTTTLEDNPGYAVGLEDGTLRHVGGGSARILAGSGGQHCADATQACGDGGPASAALLGTPDGLAVGLDGSLYIADSTLHRVRRIHPGKVPDDANRTITTVAGTGRGCTDPSPTACGNGGPASAAQFVGPYGVWIDTLDQLVIADGKGGLRQIATDGTLAMLAGTDAYDVRSVTGDATGRLYAAALDPDYLVQFDPAYGQTSVVVGTGTSGYNSNQDDLGNLRDGTDVQINKPGGLAVDMNGNIMFADTGNNLIRAFVPDYGTVIDDLGGVIPGQSSSANGCKWADQTKLSRPTAVASSGGALFVVADAGSARLLQLGPAPLDETKASCPSAVNAVVSSKLAQATPTAREKVTPTARSANATTTPVATRPVATPTSTR
jgi:uncharacterized protein YjbI with pentapeptide repeats